MQVTFLNFIALLIFLARSATSVPLANEALVESAASPEAMQLYTGLQNEQNEIESLSNKEKVQQIDGQLTQSTHDIDGSMMAPIAIIHEDNKAKKCKDVGEYCQLPEHCCSKRCLTYAAKCVT